MKGSEVQKISHKLLPNFPGFAVRRADFFKVPLDGFFTGVCFQASNYDKNSFYLNMICQPLFMPVGQSGHYIGSFNMFRLRPLKTNFYKLRLKSAKLNFDTFRLLLGETNDELWYWNDPDILEKLQRVLERDLLPFSKQMSDPLNFIEYAEPYRANNSQTLKAIGFTQVKLGQKNLAIKTFEELISLPINEYGTKTQNELKDEARSIIMLLKETPDAAAAQLSKWEDEAIEALKLQKFKV